VPAPELSSCCADDIVGAGVQRPRPFFFKP
jgi:hypothetical protein